MSRKVYRDAPKSDLDSQRELLDSLMGINRNHDREEEELNDFRDEKVCKFYLLGMCPHEMFVNTKMDCGPCPKIHSDKLREDFNQKHSEEEGIRMYDQMIEREFTSRIAEIDRIIDVSEIIHIFNF